MELIRITFLLLLQLNYVAVVVAAIAAFVLGFLWYGPIFGKKWMKYSGISAESMKKVSQKDMIGPYAVTFLTAFIETTFLLFFALILQTQLWHAAVLIWFGFILFNSMGIVFWDNKPWGLYFINVGYRLVNLLVMGFVLSFFY